MKIPTLIFVTALLAGCSTASQSPPSPSAGTYNGPNAPGVTAPNSGLSAALDAMGVSQYPGSTFDPAGQAMKVPSMIMIPLRTPDPPDKVADYYAKELGLPVVDAGGGKMVKGKGKKENDIQIVAQSGPDGTQVVITATPPRG